MIDNFYPTRPSIMLDKDRNNISMTLNNLQPCYRHVTANFILLDNTSTNSNVLHLYVTHTTAYMISTNTPYLYRTMDKIL